jgi:hypothetical protein
MHTRNLATNSFGQHSLIPKFKPCLVVKINDIQFPTTQKGWESGFGRVKYENTTPQEVFHSMKEPSIHTLKFVKMVFCLSLPQRHLSDDVH